MPVKRTSSSRPTGGTHAGAPAPSVVEVADKPEYRVEALAKGLRLLSLFDEQRPSWRVTDLAAAAGLPVPTVYRVVMTLTAEGYLDHLPNGDYRPGREDLDPRHGRAAQPRPGRSGHAQAAAPRRVDAGDGEPRGAHRRPRALPDPAAQLRPGHGQHPGRLHPAGRHHLDRQAAAGPPGRRRAARAGDSRVVRGPARPEREGVARGAAGGAAEDPRAGLGHAGRGAGVRPALRRRTRSSAPTAGWWPA